MGLRQLRCYMSPLSLPCFGEVHQQSWNLRHAADGLFPRQERLEEVGPCDLLFPALWTQCRSDLRP